MIRASKALLITAELVDDAVTACFKTWHDGLLTASCDVTDTLILWTLQGKLTVVLDLDGTLISSFTPRRAPRLPPGSTSYIVGKGGRLNPQGVFVVERPGLQEFFRQLSTFAGSCDTDNGWLCLIPYPMLAITLQLSLQMCVHVSYCPSESAFLSEGLIRGKKSAKLQTLIAMKHDCLPYRLHLPRLRITTLTITLPKHNKPHDYQLAVLCQPLSRSFCLGASH